MSDRSPRAAAVVGAAADPGHVVPRLLGLRWWTGWRCMTCHPSDHLKPEPTRKS